MNTDYLVPCDPGPRKVCRSDPEKELGCSHEHGNLPNPGKEHPFDDLRLDIRAVLFGHQALGGVLFLLPEGELETFGDGTSLGRFDVGRFHGAESGEDGAN